MKEGNSEKILWTGKSCLKPFFDSRDYVIFPFLIIMFLCGVMLSISCLRAALWGGLVFIIFINVIPIGYLLFNRVYSRYKRRKFTHYLLTDRMIIIAYKDNIKKINYKSLKWYQPEIRSDGSGSIYFERRKSIFEFSWFGDNSIDIDDWLGIIEVNEASHAAEIIEEKIKDLDIILKKQ